MKRVSFAPGVIALVLACAGVPAGAQNVCVSPEAVASGAQKTKSTLMNERTYRRLLAAQEAFAEERYDDVLKILRALEAGNLTPYEHAQILQTYGFVYAQRARYDEAVRYFERALAMDALPDAAQQGMLYSLAGLYAQQENHPKTVEAMERWFPNAKDPPGDAYIVLGAAYAQSGDYANAAPCVALAIEKADTADESWYQLLLGIRFDQENYPEAAKLLRKMVALWPNRLDYWEMFSGAYRRLEKPSEALAVMKLAYDKGLITQERKLIELVNLHVYAELPYEGGRLLEQEIASGRLRASETNLRLLLHTWTRAREIGRALGVIDQLAPRADNGEYYLQRAQLLAERGDWPDVVDAVDQALAKGGLNKPGAAYVLKGMALAEQERYGRALQALEQALGYDDQSRRQAEGWISFVNDRREIN